MKYLILTPALLLGACASTADTTQSRAQAAEQGSVSGVNENGERTRCEYIRETGTRFRTRVCHTEREWERIEENAQQVAQDAQNRSLPDQGPGVSGF